jgi:hypothetical protein
VNVEFGAVNQTKLPRSLVFAPSDAIDKDALPELWHCQERSVNDVTGYAGQNDLMRALALVAKAFFNERPCIGNMLTSRHKAGDRNSSRIGDRFVHAFGVFKCVFTFSKLLYCGLAMNGNRAFGACGLENVFRRGCTWYASMAGRLFVVPRWAGNARREAMVAHANGR